MVKKQTDNKKKSSFSDKFFTGLDVTSAVCTLAIGMSFLSYTVSGRCYRDSILPLVDEKMAMICERGQYIPLKMQIQRDVFSETFENMSVFDVFPNPLPVLESKREMLKATFSKDESLWTKEERDAMGWVNKSIIAVKNRYQSGVQFLYWTGNDLVTTPIVQRQAQPVVSRKPEGRTY